MRRRTGVLACAALLGLLAGCSSPGSPGPSTSGRSSFDASASAASGARAWVPSDQYVDPASLVGRVAALVPKPTTVTSANASIGADPVCPVADVPCLRPAYSVDLAVADGDLTSVLLVTQSVAAVPDVGADPCVPPGLPHSSGRLPLRRDDAVDEARRAVAGRHASRRDRVRLPPGDRRTPRPHGGRRLGTAR